MRKDEQEQSEEASTHKTSSANDKEKGCGASILDSIDKDTISVMGAAIGAAIAQHTPTKQHENNAQRNNNNENNFKSNSKIPPEEALARIAKELATRIKQRQA